MRESFKNSKYIVMFVLLILRTGRKRAEFLKKIKFFYQQGKNCQYHSLLLPSEPYLVSFGDNVHISANVRFITHDIVSDIFNTKFQKELFKFYIGRIKVGNNVMIGANSVILYDINIGDDVIIAAGSVVTKNIETGTIVGGNPAKKIGYTADLIEKRMNEFGRPTNTDHIGKILDFFWKND